MRKQIIFLVLSILYIFGAIGLCSPKYKPIVAPLTPLNLLLTTVLFILGLKQFNKTFFSIAALIFLLGYGVEVAGVKSGILFGAYKYGTGLGLKLFDVPLIIGVNWFLLSFSASGLAMKISHFFLVRVLIASCIMVLLDYVIEPVAIALEFWNWEVKGEIPIQNYLMWFICAWIMNSIILSKIKQLDFDLSVFIVILQFTFFGLLHLLIL